MCEKRMTIQQFDIMEDMVLLYKKSKGKYEDQTYELQALRENPNNSKQYIISYGNGEKEYTPNKSNVRIFHSPVRIDIGDIWMQGEDDVRCTYNVDVGEIECILVFGEGKFVRLIYKDGRKPGFIEDGGQIIDKTIMHHFAYIKQILEKKIDAKKKQDLDAEPERKTPEDDLQSTFEWIRYISKKSVLYQYLHGLDIRSNVLEKNTIIYPFDFNLSQKHAVETALSNNISMIEGPPGTGKTQTILNIIANLIAVQNKTVIVVSNNNAAIQNVKDKLDENYKGITAMLGSREKQQQFYEAEKDSELEVEQWKYIGTLDLIKKNRQIQVLLNSLMYTQQQMQRKKQELRKWKVEQENFEKNYGKQIDEYISHDPKRCDTSDQILTFFLEYDIALEGRWSDRLIYAIKLLFKYRLKTTKMPDRQMIMLLQRRFYELKVQEISKAIDGCEKQLKEHSFRELTKMYNSVSMRLFNQYLYDKYNQQTTVELKKNVSEYSDLQYKEFLHRYPVVLSTNQSVLKSMPQDYMFDYAIVDEASQCDLISSMLVMKCCKNIVIVGDEKQLKCITNDDIAQNVSVRPLDERYDYFTESLMSSVRKVFNDRITCTTLLEHYRCPPKVIGFCNERYYDGRLIAYTEEPEDRDSMILFKTVEGNHTRINNVNDRGIYNQREIDCVIEIMEKFHINSDDDIGFIAPFRLQVQKANDVFGSYKGLECDTIHKFQGRAKDIIVFSTVLDDKRESAKRAEFVESKNLINVAVSRARRQFILDTHSNFFEKNDKEVAALIQYIQYNSPKAIIQKSNTVSIFDLLYNEYSAQLEKYRKKIRKVRKDEKAQELMRIIIEEVLQEKEFDLCCYNEEVYLYNLCNKTDQELHTLFSEKEYDYYKIARRVDFVVYRKMNKEALLVIEVDGHGYHENKVGQQEEDRIRDSIVSKFGISIIRFATNGSREKEKLESALGSVLNI